MGWTILCLCWLSIAHYFQNVQLPLHYRGKERKEERKKERKKKERKNIKTWLRQLDFLFKMEAGALPEKKIGDMEWKTCNKKETIKAHWNIEVWFSPRLTGYQSVTNVEFRRW